LVQAHNSSTKYRRLQLTNGGILPAGPTSHKRIQGV